MTLGIAVELEDLMRRGENDSADLDALLGCHVRRLPTTPAGFSELPPRATFEAVLGVDAPYATPVVDDLRRQGLVERRAHPADRRWSPRESPHWFGACETRFRHHGHAPCRVAATVLGRPARSAHILAKVAPSNPTDGDAYLPGSSPTIEWARRLTCTHRGPKWQWLGSVQLQESKPG